MKQLVSVIGVLISLAVASEASANSCTNRTNFSGSITPYTYYYSVTQGFLQHFSNSNFSCNGDTSYQHCVHKSEVFNFYFDNGTVYVYNATTWIHTGSYAYSGPVYNWSWDSGAASGYLTYSCLAYDLNFNCTNYAYGTCD